MFSDLDGIKLEMSNNICRKIPKSLKLNNICLNNLLIEQGIRRKIMTNLDSILKSRDITLATKVHLVKPKVFPVVIYGCESWTVKKAER